MSTGLKVEKLKGALKELLKKKGLQYKDLANELGCSLPTVKRFLTSGELDLNRLLQICEVVDVSLSELEKIAEIQKTTQMPFFTLEQEEYLSKNLPYLSFLAELYSGYTAERIAEKYGLNKKSLELYQIRLEKIGLLKSKGGRYEKVHSEFPNFNKHSPILRSQLTQLLDTFNNFLKRRLNSAVHGQVQRDPMRFTLSTYSIPRHLFSEWEIRYQKLIDELNGLSDVYQKAGSIENIDKIVLGHGHVVLRPDDPDFHHSAFLFGKIENL